MAVRKSWLARCCYCDGRAAKWSEGPSASPHQVPLHPAAEAELACPARRRERQGLRAAAAKQLRRARQLSPASEKCLAPRFPLRIPRGEGELLPLSLSLSPPPFRFIPATAASRGGWLAVTAALLSNSTPGPGRARPSPAQPAAQQLWD